MKIFIIFLITIILLSCSSKESDANSNEIFPKENHGQKNVLEPERREYIQLVDTSLGGSLSQIVNGRMTMPKYSFSLKGGLIIDPITAKGIGKNLNLKYDNFYKKAAGNYLNSDNELIHVEIELLSKESELFPNYKFTTIETNSTIICNLEIVSLNGLTEIEIKNNQTPMILKFNTSLPEDK